MGAKKKEIRTINKTDIELNERLQRVNRIYSLQTDKNTEFIEADMVPGAISILKSSVPEEALPLSPRDAAALPLERRPGRHP